MKTQSPLKKITGQANGRYILECGHTVANAMRGAALKAHMNPGPTIRPIKSGPWRSHTEVMKRHAFMVQLRDKGLKLKEIQQAFKAKYGRTVDHATILYHTNGARRQCGCGLPRSETVHAPKEPKRHVSIYHEPIVKLAGVGMGTFGIMNVLGCDAHTVRYHRDGKCQCEVEHGD